jgi:hypothetical protein
MVYGLAALVVFLTLNPPLPPPPPPHDTSSHCTMWRRKQ